ncbi:hypothetical protein J4573_33775 [Actinomadura barringtoniae]|uniref:DUF11 domain-containing protein n=1 Tax=Actinomadura barringtoniae TaxID=1427535 RepID=A0A939PLI7_9ACTN|nr:DUF11 domain-containing protein [Actinomadura barringtoniae]MBO2452099.1 hypothetical protein [Actinomadura barringtoniae]
MRRVLVAHGSAVAVLLITIGPARAASRPMNGADLRVRVTGPSARVKTGDVLDYAVQVHNAGPAAVGSATAVAWLPAQIAVISYDDGRCHERAATLRCPVSLASGETRTVHILGIVKPAATGAFRVRAKALWARDPIPGNNHAALAARVAPSTDVAVRLSAPRHMPRMGWAALAVTVVNRGPNPSRRVTLHVGAHGARLAAPAGHHCKITGDGAGGRFLHCALGWMASGAGHTLYVRVRPSSGGRVLVQDFAASASPELGDRRPGNNTATARVRPAR